jgi:hypothetical protein
LEKCRGDHEPGSKTPPSCGLIDKWSQGWYRVTSFVNLANCKSMCNAEPKCLSYSAGRNPNSSNCYLYDKETADLPHGTYQNWIQYDKRCS